MARGKDSGRTTIAIATVYKRETRDADKPLNMVPLIYIFKGPKKDRSGRASARTVPPARALRPCLISRRRAVSRVERGPRLDERATRPKPRRQPVCVTRCAHGRLRGPQFAMQGSSLRHSVQRRRAKSLHSYCILSRSQRVCVLCTSDMLTCFAPTAYPDVYFFEYCNDLPISEKNQP